MRIDNNSSNKQKSPIKKNGKRSSALKITLCGLFTALIAAGAFIKIPIPNLPFTLQDMFVLLGGLLLGPALGGMSAFIYMIIGLAGIPVFTQGGGIGYVLRPSFGYIIGFVIGAFVSGIVSRRVREGSYFGQFLAALSGLAVIYAVGIPYFWAVSTFYLGKTIALWPLLGMCLFTTLPGDIALCFLAAYISKALRPAIKRYLPR